MRMNRLAFATLVAMGMTAAAIAQQPGQQPTPRSAQPQTQPAPPRNSQPAPGSRSTETAPAPRGGDRTEQVSFDRADKNADGRISREEGNDIDGFDFSRADTNNDASLSRQEYQAAMATSTPREGPAARNEAGGSVHSGDASASSRSSEAPGSRSAESASRSGEAPGSRSTEAPSQRSAQVTFDAADKNKDGKITRDEATVVPGLNFTSADVDADTSLSRQEFQTAMAGAQPRG
jgi:Ca2+-binding EF-hand superfamily protein